MASEHPEHLPAPADRHDPSDQTFMVSGGVDAEGNPVYEPVGEVSLSPTESAEDTEFTIRPVDYPAAAEGAGAAAIGGALVPYEGRPEGADETGGDDTATHTFHSPGGADGGAGSHERAARRIEGSTDALGRRVDELGGRMDHLADTVSEALGADSPLAGAVTGLGESVDGVTERVDDLHEVVEGATEAVTGVGDRVDAVGDAVREVRTVAEEGFADATRATEDVRRAVDRTGREVGAAVADVGDRVAEAGTRAAAELEALRTAMTPPTPAVPRRVEAPRVELTSSTDPNALELMNALRFMDEYDLRMNAPGGSGTERPTDSQYETWKAAITIAQQLVEGEHGAANMATVGVDPTRVKTLIRRSKEHAKAVRQRAQHHRPMLSEADMQAAVDDPDSADSQTLRQVLRQLPRDPGSAAFRNQRRLASSIRARLKRERPKPGTYSDEQIENIATSPDTYNSSVLERIIDQLPDRIQVVRSTDLSPPEKARLLAIIDAITPVLESRAPTLHPRPRRTRRTP